MTKHIHSLPVYETVPRPTGGQASQDLAFRRLFERYHTPLLVRAERIVSCPHIAQEVVLDVLLKFWQQPEATIQSTVEGYLKSMTTNRSIDYLRRRKRERRFHGELPLHRPCTATRPDALLHSKQIGLAIERAIDDLPPRGQEIFRLNRFQGLTYQQIADHCGLSYKTVETHMRRSLVKLRNRLRKYQE